ncbi:hypothetical protein CPC08DRAFT_758547 [Agrocybe pediades]|nr:hypothetical protein CPC08DRAFT_758547 [Agrocybe pediades]
MLTPDILVDQIFPLLYVEELIQFRQTCKTYYLLTHEAVIWKRYLERMRIPVQQMRPTLQYRELVANYEIESFVTAACALDRSWRRGEPVLWREEIHASQYRIIELKMVPGGKFLVASVRDKRNYRFFILVYALDVLFGSRMLARVPTHYKAFNLQVKYMKHEGVDGIMISYVRRRFKDGVPLQSKHNINNLYQGAPVTLPKAVVYEACSLHMRLDSVEVLIAPYSISPRENKGRYTGMARQLELPFKDVYNYQTLSEIHSLTQFQFEGTPCMAFVEDNHMMSVIHIRRLDNDFAAELRCNSYIVGAPHRIRTIRFLPCQRGLLVVRTIRQFPGMPDLIVFEIYDLPVLQHGIQNITASKRWECSDEYKLTGEFVISDAEVEKTSESHPDILREECGPPTIWLFASAREPKGCSFWWFRASLDPLRPGEYRYDQQGGGLHQNDHNDECGFPGVERSLVLEFEGDEMSETKILKKIRRFHWPSYRFPMHHLVPNPGPPVTLRAAENSLSLVDISFSDRIGGIINNSGGLVALAWDETSGKICLAGEKDEAIRIMDMAPIAEITKKLAYRWAREKLIPTEFDAY